MRVVDLEHARGSLARGLAGQALVDAAQDNADMARILMELHGIAPNPRSRQRFAARLRGRRNAHPVGPSWYPPRPPTPGHPGRHGLDQLAELHL